MTPEEQENEKVRRDLQAIARTVDDQLPFGWGFIVLAFPFTEGGRMNYVSNAERADVVRALYEFIEATKDKWGEHEPELSAAAEDSQLGRARQELAQLEGAYAMLMRCCAKAIHRLERNGLKRDAEQIRRELRAFDIDVTIMPDPTIEGN
jgi:hypothetical protein